MKENILRQRLTTLGCWAALVLGVTYLIAAAMTRDLIYLAVATSMIALSLSVRVYGRLRPGPRG